MVRRKSRRSKSRKSSFLLKKKAPKRTRRKSKRRYKRKSLLRKKRTKSLLRKKRTKNRRKSRKVRKRRRRKVQKGGVVLGACKNPFVGAAKVNGASGGNYHALNGGERLVGSELTRQGAGYRPMSGGGSIFRNLGLTFPEDLYNDSMDFLTNVKNAYVGDRQDSTSNVTQQKLQNKVSNRKLPDYLSEHRNTVQQIDSELNPSR